ncbi:MAG TPA: cupin domain-containing protein [Pseudoneobacillus sp.]|nr:cupin domain-containing protein [Pseudoneobacillus sp.]
MKVYKEIASHYKWGDNCDGWHMVKNDQLSVIFEKMPPNTSEMRHSHNRSQQFFFILKGTAVMELNGEEFTLEQEEGIEVPPLALHQILNRSDQDVEFLVISQPNSHGDRVLG